MAISLIESSFSLHNIKIIEGFVEKEKIPFRLILGELLQVLISILTNAKDALLENKIKDKWIKYELIKKEYSLQITIEDNAGGVDEKIIDKIFDSYFTTKDYEYSTGIGLYSSYDIVVNKLGGKLFVENTEHGAKFFIELPLNIDYVI
jgi:C4-dicarboxylate-specific signal transduction histidine kinase